MAIAECRRVTPPLEAKQDGRIAACIRVEPAMVAA
jgi:hypothetical protein